ncbi:hypothetical protein ABZ470_29315 [Streptosporangium sp. NPDC020072]|uniref:hypothetical protein n=1 Tax=Streptosporangium sp. NPDC020072 TaxID=3154788 RepID=UPI003426D962
MNTHVHRLLRPQGGADLVTRGSVRMKGEEDEQLQLQTGQRHRPGTASGLDDRSAENRQPNEFGPVPGRISQPGEGLFIGFCVVLVGVGKLPKAVGRIPNGEAKEGGALEAGRLRSLG